MFYDIFYDLCIKKGVKPGPAAEACGINRSNVSLWKSKGYTPRGEALNAIAKYFDVPVDYLLGNQKNISDDSNSKIRVNDSDEDLIVLMSRGGDNKVIKLSPEKKEKVKKALQLVLDEDDDIDF